MIRLFRWVNRRVAVLMLVFMVVFVIFAFVLNAKERTRTDSAICGALTRFVAAHNDLVRQDTETLRIALSLRDPTSDAYRLGQERIDAYRRNLVPVPDCKL